jgi:hypothetical protein
MFAPVNQLSTSSISLTLRGEYRPCQLAGSLFGIAIRIIEITR